MDEQVTLEAEFLRRALGQEETDLVVTPGALPPDFPVTVPELAGVRVLGGVRSVEGRLSQGSVGTSARLTHWRAFLDVPGPQAQVMRALVRPFEARGWQVGQMMWRAAFVEASRSEWLGVHTEQRRMLRLFTRAVGGSVQVALDVQDTGLEQLQHLLGLTPHFHRRPELPLPTLTAPEGWQVQMQGGGGGEAERSERAGLVPPSSEAVDLTALLAHFSPQLERQGWNVLHIANEAVSVYLTARTGQGVGILTLGSDAETYQVALLHMALANPGERTRPAVWSAFS